MEKKKYAKYVMQYLYMYVGKKAKEAEWSTVRQQTMST